MGLEQSIFVEYTCDLYRDGGIFYIIAFDRDRNGSGRMDKYYSSFLVWFLVYGIYVRDYDQSE